MRPFKIFAQLLIPVAFYFAWVMDANTQISLLWGYTLLRGIDDILEAYNDEIN